MSKRLVIQHKPSGRKAVVIGIKSKKVMHIVMHIVARNNWMLQHIKLKHITNSK